MNVETNARKAVECGGVPLILHMYKEWHKIDTKHRQVALRKALLNILKHITNTSKTNYSSFDEFIV